MDGIHDIQDKMPCIALTPFKHNNGLVKYQRDLLNPLSTDFQKLDSSLATNRSKPNYDTKPLLDTSASKLETQATERLYKGALPGNHIVYSVSIFDLLTTPINT